MSLCRGCHYIEENEKLKKRIENKTDKIALSILVIWVTFCAAAMAVLFRAAGAL